MVIVIGVAQSAQAYVIPGGGLGYGNLYGIGSPLGLSEIAGGVAGGVATSLNGLGSSLGGLGGLGGPRGSLGGFGGPLSGLGGPLGGFGGPLSGLGGPLGGLGAPLGGIGGAYPRNIGGMGGMMGPGGYGNGLLY